MDKFYKDDYIVYYIHKGLFEFQIVNKPCVYHKESILEMIDSVGNDDFLTPNGWIACVYIPTNQLPIETQEKLLKIFSKLEKEWDHNTITDIKFECDNCNMSYWLYGGETLEDYECDNCFQMDVEQAL